MSVGSSQRPQAAPDLVQLVLGAPEPALQPQHHALLLLHRTAVQPLQLLLLL